MMAQPEIDNGWSFKVIALPKFISNRDKGYFNANIEATFPGIQLSIDSDT